MARTSLGEAGCSSAAALPILSSAPLPCTRRVLGGTRTQAQGEQPEHAHVGHVRQGWDQLEGALCHPYLQSKQRAD